MNETNEGWNELKKAEPRPGFEARVAGRIESRIGRRSQAWLWGGLAAASAVVAVYFLVPTRHDPPGSPVAVITDSSPDLEREIVDILIEDDRSIDQAIDEVLAGNLDDNDSVMRRIERVNNTV